MRLIDKFSYDKTAYENGCTQFVLEIHSSEVKLIFTWKTNSDKGKLLNNYISDRGSLMIKGFIAGDITYNFIVEFCRRYTVKLKYVGEGVDLFYDFAPDWKIEEVINSIESFIISSSSSISSSLENLILDPEDIFMN